MHLSTFIMDPPLILWSILFPWSVEVANNGSLFCVFSFLLEMPMQKYRAIRESRAWSFPFMSHLAVLDDSVSGLAGYRPAFFFNSILDLELCCTPCFYSDDLIITETEPPVHTLHRICVLYPLLRDSFYSCGGVYIWVDLKDGAPLII